MSGNKQILDALNFLVSKKSGNDFIGSFVSNDQNSEPGYFLLFFGRADLCGSFLDYSLNYKTKSGFVDFKAITNVFSDSEFTRFELSDYIFDGEHADFSFEFKKEIQDFFKSFTKENGTHEYEILNGAFLALEHSEKEFIRSLDLASRKKNTYH